jgi:hypothetical protein
MVKRTRKYTEPKGKKPKFQEQPELERDISKHSTYQWKGQGEELLYSSSGLSIL